MMSLLLESPVTSTMPLSEYTAILDGYGPELNECALIETRDAFKALLNDRSFVADMLSAEIVEGRFQLVNPWFGSSFVLKSAPSYTIRVNIWNPPQEVATPKSWENLLYSYEYPHDHNFAFLTGGYSGPGYRTIRFEYDPEECLSLRVGDVPKSLTELGPKYLEQGSMMLYRESRDIHVQEYPTAPSISLNVLIPGVKRNPQLVFERAGGPVSRIMRSDSTLPQTLKSIQGLLAAHTPFPP
jgi:hypothetical protein